MAATQTVTEDLNYGITLPASPAFADTESVVDCAVEAEEAGWDGVFIGDHLIYPWDDPDPEDMLGVFDPWITFAGIATRTERLELGTWITPVPRRQPWQLARNLATLDHLSDGRVILGAGLGTEPDFTRFGRTFDQRRLGEQYDEALDVITGLWSGEPFSYDGEHYTIDEAMMLPTPVQEPRIPTVMGCWWPHKKPFQRAANWDGLMPSVPSFGEEAGPHGLEAKGTPEEEVQEMLEYYHGITDEPGDIFLPLDPPGSSADYVDVCVDLGVTWFYTRDLLAPEYTEDPARMMERIRQGPPT